jgi:hypothetical protein
VQVTGVLTEPVVSSTVGRGLDEPDGGREPLLRFVDLSNVHISTAMRLELPTWGRPVAASGIDPLIIAGEQDGRNVVLFAFDLRDSDLPLQPAFPLLVRNLMSYLLPLPAGGLPAEVAPGEPVGISLVSTDVTRIVIEDPAAHESLLLIPEGANRAAFAETTRQGVYYVTQYAQEEIVAQEAFAVNLFSREESLATPNHSPGLPPSAAAGAPGTEGAATGRTDDTLFRRELWPLLALAGVFVLLLEWLYAQRIAVRRAIVEWQSKRAMQKLERM